MPSAAPELHPWSTPPYESVAQIVALAEQISRMLAIAGALTASRRPIDLNGLQNNVGLLCARALDLPPGQAGLARAEMIRLVAGLDALSAALRGERA
jgi:hypothetical protein